jgi:tripeptidyl-peptidase I
MDGGSNANIRTNKELYGIPKGNSSHPGNEIGIFETGDYYDQEDLDLTFAVIAPELPNGTHPILHGIDGGYAPFEGMAGGESILDMTLIIPLVYPQNSILYQVDDWWSLQLYSGFGNTFLDALDAVTIFPLRDSLSVSTLSMQYFFPAN